MTLSAVSPPAPAPAPEPSGWFPLTRLGPPTVAADVLARPRLLARLVQAVQACRLTLISAPAGAGKTTLLAALPAAAPDLAFAWLTLTEDDNDPATFLTALLAALRRRCPGQVTNALHVLASLPDPETDLRPAVSVLINDLLEAQDRAPSRERLVLVLDDLHTLTHPAALQALDALLEWMPALMRIVIATRHDPPLALARLRARGQLAELRREDLSLNPEELDVWLNAQQSLGLSARSLALLHQRTEGWVAGVRLLALSLRGRADPNERHALLARLAAGQGHVFDYLIEEVLSREAPAVRAFLLETSILSELTPAVCQAVTGRADSAEVLADLFRRNLFLNRNAAAASQAPQGVAAARAETATVEPSYRYHALFAQFLRQQLALAGASRASELHLRAAAAQTSPDEAIRHYLLAGDAEAAADVLETAGRQLLAQGTAYRLARWLRQLPPALMERRPWLATLLGHAAVQNGHYEAAQPWLQKALKGFETSGDEEGQTDALALLGEVFTCLADVPQAVPLLERSRARPQPLRRWVKTEVNLAWMDYYRGDWDRQAERLVDLVARVEAAQDLGAFHSLVLSLGPQLPFAAHGVSVLERFCQRSLAAAGPGAGPVQAGAEAYLAYLEALQGRVPAAVRSAERASRLIRLMGGFAHLDYFTDHVVLLGALQRGDHAAFDACFEAALERVERVTTLRQMLPCYLHLGARRLWLGARPAAVGEWQARLAATSVPYELPEGQVARCLLAGLAAWSDGRTAEAEAAWQQAVAAQRPLRHSLLMTDARLDLAGLYLATGRSAQARPLAAEALADLAARGFPGVAAQGGEGVRSLLIWAITQGLSPAFSQRALALLAPAPAAPEPAPAPALARPLEGGEALSARELEVLRLIADGLNNQEIAARLVIAPGSAKRHSINIYRKLGVSSRTQAVARARALHLL
jgi:LuxR family maltose regulon positive regulatory protein